MMTKSFAGTRCLIVSSNQNIGSLLIGVLGNIGIIDVVHDSHFESVLLHIKSASFDLIICATLSDDDNVRVLEAVRNHVSPVACRLPIICINESWGAEQITLLRNAGVSVLSVFPLTIRNLLKYVTRALNDTREFITVPSYRGPCRRRVGEAKYGGPFRRSTDTDSRRTAAVERHAPSPAQSDGVSAKVDETSHLGGGQSPVFSKTHKSEVSNDPIEHQTGHAIENAVITAKYICVLVDRISSTTSVLIKPDDAKRIAEFFERWINLMELVTDRIKNYGCTTKQLDALAQMRLSFQKHMATFADRSASTIFADGKKLLATHDQIPHGLLNPLVHRQSSLDILVETFPDICTDQAVMDKVDLSRKTVEHLIASAAATLVLKEFDQGRKRNE